MNIAVFCGSKLPENKVYHSAIKELGYWIAENNNTLVYGGANVGVMRILADAVLEKNGKVIGVMPEILSQKEIIHQNLSETHIVDSMASRKELMNDLSDAFIAFPGGCGTMDEIFEVITLNQIGYFNKPTIFYNVEGYYDGIKNYLETAKTVGFSSVESIDDIHFVNNIQCLSQII